MFAFPQLPAGGNEIDTIHFTVRLLDQIRGEGPLMWKGGRRPCEIDMLLLLLYGIYGVRRTQPVSRLMTAEMI